MTLRTAVNLTIPCLLALCSRASASGPFIYGYVSSFGQQSAATSQANMDWLASYHVNDVQFYDWQWKQHVPLAGTVQAPAASWSDIAGRTNYRQTVQGLIAACHADGMKAMNYNLINGAWAGYGQDGSGVSYKWGLWHASNGTQQWSDPLPAGWSAPALYMFNPADPNWQNYIFSREADAINAYGFDGWQADQLGNPGQVYTFSGASVNVASTFAGFLNNAKTALNTSVIFNNVGGYGLQSVASQTNNDAIYVECWPQTGQVTYNDLKTVIDESLNWGNGKPVVLAAYMDSNLSSGTFGTAGVLLTDATIFANGGTHLELGDGGHMLSQPYFPNHNVTLSAGLANTLHSYYDFIVANQGWLYAGMANSANRTVLTGVPSAAVATAGDVWTLTRTSATNHRQMINLINLVGESTINWTDATGAAQAPTAQSNLPVKYYYGSGTISSVSFASPDISSPPVQSLAFQTGSDGNGNYVTFTVPALYYWDTIMLNTAAVSSGWASSAGGSWTRTAGNWTNGTPGLAGDTATFGSGPGLTGAGAITLDGNVYVGHLVFNNTNSYTIAQGSAGTLTIDNIDGSGNPDITVVAGNHTISAPVALANGVTVNTAAGASMNISGALAGTGGLTKTGAGLLELSGSGGYTGTTNITGGTLKFNIASGTPTIAAGVTATVASGATLELAGSVSALGTAVGNREHIVNNSLGDVGAAAGLVVSGTNQVVGSIDGSGTTQVNAGSDLTANHIIQSALVIGGAAGSPGLVTINASGASGNPLGVPSGFVVARSLTPSGPFGAGESSFASVSSVGDGVDVAAVSLGNSVGGDPSPVPEPSTLLLALLAVLGVVSAQFMRRHFQFQTV